MYSAINEINIKKDQNRLRIDHQSHLLNVFRILLTFEK